MASLNESEETGGASIPIRIYKVSARIVHDWAKNIML